MSKATAEAPSTKTVSARVDVDTFRRIKVAAVLRDSNMAEVIGEALRMWLSRYESQTEGSKAGA